MKKKTTIAKARKAKLRFQHNREKKINTGIEIDNQELLVNSIFGSIKRRCNSSRIGSSKVLKQKFVKKKKGKLRKKIGQFASSKASLQRAGSADYDLRIKKMKDSLISPEKSNIDSIVKRSKYSVVINQELECDSSSVASLRKSFREENEKNGLKRVPRSVKNSPSFGSFSNRLNRPSVVSPSNPHIKIMDNKSIDIQPHNEWKSELFTVKSLTTYDQKFKFPGNSLITIEMDNTRHFFVRK